MMQYEIEIHKIQEDLRAVQRTLKAQKNINVMLTGVVVKWFSILVDKNLITIEDIDVPDEVASIGKETVNNLMDTIKKVEP